jgi:5-(hydroxymethyl)furfural/furfural oxidase
VAPRVRFNLLDDPRDLERLVDGLQLALEILSDEEVVRTRNEVFTPNVAIGARLGKRSAWSWLQSCLISAAIRVGPIRRGVLNKDILDVRSMASDPHAVRRYVRQHAHAVYHVCGTCRMGDPDDPDTVVDPSCRVPGVRGLRVVDASIFPTVPSAATHLPVIMAAEKAADQIKAEWSNQLLQRAGST